MARDDYERRRPARGRRYADDYEEDFEDEGADDEDDEELSDDERRLGLKVVELGPRGLRINPAIDQRRRPDGRIFHEFDPRHPNGEVLVVKGRRVKVYPTARVQQALGEGLLTESTRPETPTPPNIADILDQQRQQAAEINAHAQRQIDAHMETASATPADAQPAPAVTAAKSEPAPAAARSTESARRR